MDGVVISISESYHSHCHGIAPPLPRGGVGLVVEVTDILFFPCSVLLWRENCFARSGQSLTLPSEMRLMSLQIPKVPVPTVSSTWKSDFLAGILLRGTGSKYVVVGP